MAPHKLCSPDCSGDTFTTLSTWANLVVTPSGMREKSQSQHFSQQTIKIFREKNMSCNCLKTLPSVTIKKTLTWKLAEWVPPIWKRTPKRIVEDI